MIVNVTTPQLQVKNPAEILISGSMNFHNVTALLKEAAFTIDQSSSQSIIFDFSKVDQANSAGLVFLLGLLRYASQKNKSIQFTHLPEKLWATAKISNLDKILPCKPMT